MRVKNQKEVSNSIKNLMRKVLKLNLYVMEINPKKGIEFERVEKELNEIRAELLKAESTLFNEEVKQVIIL